MATKKLTKDIIILILGVLLIICGVICAIYIESDGLDYTEEYKLYKEVKDIQNLDEARTQLKEMKIEYTITEKSITLKDYNYVSFVVNPDNTCAIKSQSYMSCFEKLDTVDLREVKIQGIQENGKFIEKFTMNSGPAIFTKVNNHYFVRATYIIWFALAILGTGITLCTISLVHLTSKRSKSKDNLNED